MAYDPNTGDDTNAPRQPAQQAPPTSASTPSTNPAYDKNVFNQGLTALYQKYYWRDPTAEEMTAHASNPDGLAGVEKMLAATPNQSQVTKPTAAPATAEPQQGAATGSPVTATGQIPAPAPAATPAPAQNGATPNETRYVAPVDLSKVPAYQPASIGNSFNPTAIPAWANPDQSANNAQQSALMQSILTNPQTMNPQVVAQLKEQQKEQALAMRDQTQQGFDAANAGSGRLGSGQAMANTRALHEAAINSILSGNRATDIAAAQTNRQDQLNAEQASEALAQGQLGRAVTGYNTGLQGAIAGSQQNQFAANNALNVAQFNADQQYKAQQDQIQRLLSQFGVNTGVAQNAQQNYGADLGAALQRFTTGLQSAQFGENQRQFNNTLGYNYNALDQSGQQSLLQYLQSRGL